MAWYYAVGSERLGPVDDAAMGELVKSGTVGPGTLVWREGMAVWQAWREVSGASGVGGAAAEGVASAATRVCSECGKAFPASELIALGNAHVCAGCKPVALSKLSEGVRFEDSGEVDPAVFESAVMARAPGIDPMACLREGRALVMREFWISLGVTLLGMVLLSAGGSIPCVGILFIVFGQPHLTAAMWFYFVRRLRGQPAGVDTLFVGFQKKSLYWELTKYGAVIFGLMVPLLVAVFVLAVLTEAKSNEAPVALILGTFAVSIPIMLLSMMWMFAPVLIMDAGLKFGPAMRISRKAVLRNFWSWIGFFLLTALLSVAGMLALCVGLLVVLPWIYAGTAAGYVRMFDAALAEARAKRGA
jgi:hypothetical protein